MYTERKKILNIYKHGQLLYEIKGNQIFSYNKGKRTEYFMFNKYGHISQFLSSDKMNETIIELQNSKNENNTNLPIPNKIAKLISKFFRIFITNTTSCIMDIFKPSNFF